MQKARSHTSWVLLQLVSIRFQVLFTPLIGVLFIIQSPYWFTIGRPGVLSLGGWTPHVHAEFHEHRATLWAGQLLQYRTITFCGQPFQVVHAATGLSAFARRYLRSRILLSFPPVTEMFQFTGFAPAPYAFRYR